MSKKHIKSMGIDIRIKLSILLIVMLLTITPALAFDSLNTACDIPSGGCHANPPVFLKNTVSISSFTATPGQTFPVTISWTGGVTSGTNTVAKWPSVLDNDKFTPTPSISTVGVFPSGTLTSTLTAPTTPGTYTLRAYTSAGTGSPNSGKETDFKVITVNVVQPASSSISLTKTPSATPVTSGTSVTYTYVVTNTGTATLTNVLVTDNILGAIGGPITLNAGASQTFTKAQVLTVSTTNIGSVTATSNTGTVTFNATATVTVTGSTKPTVFEKSGANAGNIKPTVDSFRSALGNNNGVGGNFNNGRREINWDGVPDKFAAPNLLPADFYNKNSPRGVILSTPGQAFQVSANSSNPTHTPVRFGNINPAFPNIFGTFSPQRLFTALGSNIVEVQFFVPGTNIRAIVSGFGAVFTDVNIKGSTKIEYFDVNNKLLFSRIVLPGPTSIRSLSFLGVSFGTPKLFKVRITSGSHILKNPVIDTVVMDDFIYGEPQANPSNGGFLNFGGPDNIGTNNVNTANAYYKAIDPKNQKTTLGKWKTINGFNSGDDAKTFYFNANDLGFGRSMHMKKGKCDSTGCDIAYYVSNYPTVDDARLGTNKIATVTMDYSRVTPTGPRFTKFYIYDKNDNRVISAALDDFGNKNLPNLCVICHGGEPKSDASVVSNGNVYPNNGNINASFIPFDLESLTYSGVYGFDRNTQEPQFKKLNIGILANTNPPAAVQELITGWYGGNNLQRATQNSAFVPLGWTGKEKLYNTAIKTSCRACHIMMSSQKANIIGLNFTSFDKFKNLGGDVKEEVCTARIMPNAELTFENFWYGIGPFQKVKFGDRTTSLANGGLNGWNPTDPCPAP